MALSPRYSRKVTTKGLALAPELAGRPSAFKYLWRVHIQSCMRRGIASSLTPEKFSELTSGNCTYCGCPPNNWTKLKTGKNIAYNGIDRIDQAKPYEIGNLATCCKTCNSMKSKLPVNAFLEHIKKIFQHKPLNRAA